MSWNNVIPAYCLQGDQTVYDWEFVEKDGSISHHRFTSYGAGRYASREGVRAFKQSNGENSSLKNSS